MGKIIDSIIALRIVYILYTPIENTIAFKLGLIDNSGKTIRKAKTSEENDATNPLLRLVWNLKRIIGLIPGGSSKIGGLAAAYLLMKEAIENDWTEAELTENCLTKFNDLCEAECPELDTILDELQLMNEDMPANVTGTAVSTNIPHEKLFDMVRRKKFKIIDLP